MSYSKLPVIRTFADALKRFDSTAPIRGSNPPIVPLGVRSYKHFRMEKNTDDAGVVTGISLFHYGSPLITFHNPAISDPGNPNPHQRVTIKCRGDRRWSSSDGRFVQEVMYHRFGASETSKGNLVLHPYNPHICSVPKLVVPGGGEATIEYSTNAGFQVVSATETTTLRINRKAANNVRKNYGQFFRYVKGMIGVRRHTVRNDDRLDVPVISTSFDEVYNAAVRAFAGNPDLPSLKVERHIWGYALIGVPELFSKPAKVLLDAKYDHDKNTWNRKEITYPYAEWRTAMTRFMELVSTPEGDTQTENFAAAFALVLCNALLVRVGMQQYFNDRAPLSLLRFQDGRDLMLSIKEVADMADELILKWHYAEVLDRVPTKPGTVPTDRYATWLDRERV